MVMVLRRNNAAGQITLLMFINIREYREALSAMLLGRFLRQRTTQNIANRFRTVVVTTALAQAIQRFQEFVIESNGDSLLRQLPFHVARWRSGNAGVTASARRRLSG